MAKGGKLKAEGKELEFLGRIILPLSTFYQLFCYPFHLMLFTNSATLPSLRTTLLLA